MDLFSAAFDQNQVAPLADRMRPRTLTEYLGQSHILGPGKLLRRAIEADRVSSLILYGPPGSGKTSLAQVIANTTKADFIRLNAVAAGIKEIREILQQAAEQLHLYGRRTLAFCDEVHRFNKGQQDALLPAVENGTITFIGATTENPFFEINSALLSRSGLFKLETLTDVEIRLGLERALADQERGLGRFQADIRPAAWEHWLNYANGDLRRALNALELAVLTTPPTNGVRLIDLRIAEESIQQRAIRYDKAGDNHYDLISALIKSMRGSDPDAALYWFAVLLAAGEDPRFLMRRIIIHASEDIGLANPLAMLQAQAAANALEWVGLPEARIPMAQAVLAIATSPKSNSVVAAIDKALDYVKTHPTGNVPPHLRDAQYPGAKKMGHGEGYLYPHSYPGHWVKQTYLPPEAANATFFTPSGLGQDTFLHPEKKPYSENSE
ncbi:DNA polymerase III, clamp loader complex, gamma/delta/delta subunit, C-terminal [Acididesulfobacillus acetoxydans]|uniref:DNA polymerase III, clamp loader complex, gamma/delta/delta subunit, C-terminal n=1 Tax=Acididesulfobacillus acetoxydans TaxID=1561005 RepID=A0A8S0WG33_9FIRM|nr:replication-associated recombination protein A [Acididesulfobacillus acetoxydans]CAA7601542.1 DNA polymerase III, clamp loader complex, gamma/delta/delta subunit, C-terminal [Acididesulfobacillus acetoxydans]CEJ07029.1 Replication-associated recombination protein A [Acididesulfobacillus acetoxydans]